MELATFQPLFDWLQTHPAWAGFFVFLVSLSESLLIVGLIVPGAVLMFGIGALIGAGVMGLWESMLWAFIGAVVGDGLSFWVGYYFKDSIPRLWPFHKKPELLDKGRSFFLKHGGKSILFGRFVGPIRPVIPAIAGMMHMSPSRFALFNVASALGWAPAYLLPGIVFGASLGLASEVATRLAVVVVGLAVSLWLLIMLIKRSFFFFAPRADRWIAQALSWAFRHPKIGPFTSSILDPNYPPTSGLLFWGVVLIATVWMFIYIAFATVADSPLMQLDLAIYELAQGLRNPLVDNIAIILYELADVEVLGAFAALVAVALWQSKYITELYYWLVMILGFGLAMLIFQSSLHLPRPDLVESGVFNGGFPDGRVFLATTLLGFFVVLHADIAASRWRLLVYATAAVSVVMLAFSVVLLGAAWMTDVAGALCLGLFWIILLGLAYRRHRREILTKRSVVLVALFPMLIIAPFHIDSQFSKDEAKFSIAVDVQQVSLDSWWNSVWREQAMFRSDYAGHRSDPVRIQWGGAESDIQQFMFENGWQIPPALDLKTGLYLFGAEPRFEQSALLPHVHHGRYERLRFVRVDAARNSRLVVRLWKTGTTLGSGNNSLWVGTLTEQVFKPALGMFKFPRTVDNNALDPVGELTGLMTQKHKIVKSSSASDLQDINHTLVLIDMVSNEKPKI